MKRTKSVWLLLRVLSVWRPSLNRVLQFPANTPTLTFSAYSVGWSKDPIALYVCLHPIAKIMAVRAVLTPGIMQAKAKSLPLSTTWMPPMVQKPTVCHLLLLLLPLHPHLRSLGPFVSNDRGSVVVVVSRERPRNVPGHQNRMIPSYEDDRYTEIRCTRYGLDRTVSRNIGS